MLNIFTQSVWRRRARAVGTVSIRVAASADSEKPEHLNPLGRSPVVSALVNHMLLLFGRHGRDLWLMNRSAEHVHQIETNDPIEARRSRYAQYRGLVATLTFGRATVRGMVRSVKEDSSSTPVRWLITIALT